MLKLYYSLNLSPSALFIPLTNKWSCPTLLSVCINIHINIPITISMCINLSITISMYTQINSTAVV